ncbi:DUF1491 family protein [Aestuariivirga sp.]|uniref:DUF1491 family protein n=1 Tax=Aestuariivirga sp. TaxID=2650926 RepID=UPI0039E24E27
MRLKSAIWVAAFLRRGQAEGHFGAVLKKGAEEAGAIYVIVNHLDGTFHFLGAPPGSTFSEDGERLWIEEIPFPANQESIDTLLARRRKVDPDIWVVEIEDRTGLGGLTLSKM